MQTTHATLLTVYALIASMVELPIIVQLTMLISFFPLTKFLRNNLLGLQSKAEMTMESTASAFTNTITVYVVGSLSAKYDGRSIKNGKMTPSKGYNEPIYQYMNISQIQVKESLKGSISAKSVLAIPTHVMIVAGGMGLSIGSAATGGSPDVGNDVVMDNTKGIIE
jgi:hypothetical protein